MYTKYRKIDVTFSKWYIWALGGQFMKYSSVKEYFHETFRNNS